MKTEIVPADSLQPGNVFVLPTTQRRVTVAHIETHIKARLAEPTETAVSEQGVPEDARVTPWYVTEVMLTESNQPMLFLASTPLYLVVEQ